jgi:competence protein ComEC
MTSVAAWVATGPVLIHHFHRFSAVAPVINILLVPVAFTLNLLLMIFSMLACAVPAAAAWLGMPIEWNVRILEGLVNVFDRVPGASWNLASWSAITWIVFGIWWIWLARHRKDIRRWMRVTATALIFLTLIVADAARAAVMAPEMRVTFFDVGQANAALVEVSGARLLIDAGRGGRAGGGERAVAPYLASLGVSRIDAVFVTHPQFDHAGGLEQLLRDFKIGGIWINGDAADADFYERILHLAKERGVPVRVIQRGQKITGLPDGVRLRALHPGPTSPSGDLNDHSLLLRLDAHGRSFLWTGDIGEPGLTEALMMNKLTPIDVLQVPHHGAKTGINGTEFIRQVHPGLAVISCGKDNVYGHPRAETLAALKTCSAQIHRTDQQGALQITVNKDGKLIANTLRQH